MNLPPTILEGLEKIAQSLLAYINSRKAPPQASQPLAGTTQPPQTAQTSPLPSSPVPASNPDALQLPWSDPINAHHNVRALCDIMGLTGTVVIDGVAWLKKEVLTACVKQESNFKISATHQNTVIEPDGVRRVASTDWGLVQINDYYHIGPGKDFPSVDYVLQNPEADARWMIQYYIDHGNLDAWSSYSTGAFKKWLGNSAASTL